MFENLRASAVVMLSGVAADCVVLLCTSFAMVGDLPIIMALDEGFPRVLAG